MKRRIDGLVMIAFVLLVLALSGLWVSEGEAQSTNRYVTLLSSAGRTATTASGDQINRNETLNIRGVLVTLDVSGVSSTPLITPSIQVKDLASGGYETLLTATTGVSAIGRHSYLVYPGVGAAAADVTQVASFPIGPVWRVSVAHADTDVITYTVGAAFLP